MEPLPGPYEPDRLPRACGALGAFDPERVARMAAALGPGMAEVHREADSVLVLDREPVRWQHGDARGLAWAESAIPHATDRPLASWHDAARAGLAGLVRGPGHAGVHSTVAGIAPLYRLPTRDATYFATRVDPLASTADAPLHVDWEAWAGLLTVNFLVGDRTPFEEVRRLAPYELVLRRARREERDRPEWPWARIDARTSLERGVGQVIEATRGVLARIPPGPVALPLSGGWDSRLLLCLLKDDPERTPRCITANDESGTALEEELARDAAAAAGVPHETVAGSAGDAWRDTRRYALHSDFGFATRPWFEPMLDRLATWPERPVVDGLAMDTFSQPGTRHIPPEAVRAADERAAAGILWERIAELYGGPAAVPFRAPLAARLREIGRSGFLELAERTTGSPAHALLTFFLGRTRRGPGTVPASVLGSRLAVAMPFLDDDVAHACLRIAPEEKLGARFHPAVLGELDPVQASLPATSAGFAAKHDVRARSARVPRRDLAPEVLAELREVLAAGPLAELLAPRLWRAIDRGRFPSGARKALLLHLWAERYRHRLAPLDARDLAG